MEPLRILFISPYIPSLIRVRPYNLIKYLARRGHQITLLALIPPGEDVGSLEALNEWCQRVQTVPLPRWRTLWNGLQALPSRTPLQAAYSRSPAMAKLIWQTQAEATFDVVHVEHLRGAELSRAVNSLPIVFDSVDSITLLFEWVRRSGPNWRSRWLAKLDLTRTRYYEGRLSERFPRVLITSPRDKEALAQLSTRPDADKRLVVLPNGVDLDYFAPTDMSHDPATLVFTGKMSYHANVAAAMDLANKVMPLVWQQHPKAKLIIAGKDPTAELQALTADPRITVTGTVPDLRPYLARATVAVSPMRYGVGIQNKVLEAMAMATPVITTPQTLTALQTQVGQNVLAADTPQTTAQTTINLLADNNMQQRIGQAGRRYVETYHDWDFITKKLEEAYREVIPVK
jgi:sugar transferase (PEP-CTERM/EpsH1 system associated)